MKKQQINLYKSLPRISRNWFGDALVLQISAGFVALLILVTLIQMIMLQWGQHQASVLQKKYIQVNADFVKAQKGQAGISLLQLQQELASKKQLLSLLHIKSREETTCPLLSDYFGSLSGAQTNGLWITKFKIEPDTQNIALDGMTYNPVLIVNWIRQLGRTPCFSGVKFQTINVERIAEDSNKLMRFTVNSFVVAPKTVVGGQ